MKLWLAKYGIIIGTIYVAVRVVTHPGKVLR